MELSNVEWELPWEAEKILSVLTDNGYEAFIVGGCVRDMILGRIPDDWDITTSASPVQVKELFNKTIDTGIAHGTVTVMINRVGYEVTTYRVDGEYEDCRHPKEVSFTTSLEEDLKRRDFTINAMAYNRTVGLVDLFGGVSDMQNACIRCVGNPYERFAEDALRIMRAVRFASQLGFTIEDETAAAMKRLAPNLAKVSAERVRTELVKLLNGAHPELLMTAWEAGITAVVLPEWDAMMATEQNNPHHCYNVGMHTMKGIEALHREPFYCTAEEHDRTVMNLTMLLHDSGKPMCRSTSENGTDHFYGHPERSSELAKTVLRRLKFDNDMIDLVGRLVLYHDCRFQVKTGDEAVRSVRRIAGRVGLDNLPYLFPIQRADIWAQATKYHESGYAVMAVMEEAYRVIVDENQCVSLKELAVKGRDLLEIGYQPGPELGTVLNTLLEIVVENPEQNNRDALLATAKEMLSDRNNR